MAIWNVCWSVPGTSPRCPHRSSSSLCSCPSIVCMSVSANPCTDLKEEGVFCQFKLLKPLGQFKWNILWSLKFNQIIFKNSVLPSQKNCASLQLQLTDTYFQNYIKRIYPIHGQMLSFYMLKHIIPIVTTVQCFNGLKPSKKSAIISTLHFYAWDLGSVPQLQTYGDNIHECSLWNKAKTVTIGNAIWYCSLKWL